MVIDKIVFVAGMHRSGTSAITQVLAGLGLDLGPNEALMAASPSNPHGHFELLPIVELNDELLDCVGSHWAAPQPCTAALEDLATGSYGDRARRLLEDLGITHGSVVKDPRFCLTFAFWRQVAGPSDVQLVLPFRNPVEVAASLQNRDSIPIDYGLRLWLYYHRTLLADAYGVFTCPISYERLLATPKDVIARLASDLGVPDADDSASVAAQAVDRSARHETSSDVLITVPSDVKSMLDHLEKLRAGHLTSENPVRGDEDFVGAAGLVAVERLSRIRLRSSYESSVEALNARIADLATALDGAVDRHKVEMTRLKEAYEAQQRRLTDDLSRAQSASSEVESRAAIELERVRSAYEAAETRSANAIESRAANFRSVLQETEDRHAQEMQDANLALSKAEERHRTEVEAVIADLNARLQDQQLESAANLRRVQSELLESANAYDATKRDLAVLEDQLREAQIERDQVIAALDQADDRQRSLEVDLGQRIEELNSIYDSAAGRVLRPLWDTKAGLRNRVRRASQFRLRNQRVLEAEPDGDRDDVGRVPAGVHIAASVNPQVSVVIPAHGQLDHTVRCLASLAEAPSSARIEVIVVDDASPDQTSAWLRSCSGIVQVSLSENVGYLRATNSGLRRASGEYLLLLNNDTYLERGAIDAMVEVLDRCPDVGAVGAKLVYPDGSLQEAGSIIWSDGTGWNYGRNGDPSDYRYNFLREVDYCSAACLLVRREPFEKIGWFDERYVPAYYEDTDLCFALRDLGYRVMYQPKARVVHFEGASHGTDESSGLKAYQIANRSRFCEKWQSDLTKQFAPGSDARLASWRGQSGRIVVFDHEVPAPDQDSGSLRMDAILRILTNLGVRVTFFPHNRAHRGRYNELLEQDGIEVGHGWESWRDLIATYEPELKAILASRPSVAAEVLPLAIECAPEAPAIYDMVDFHGVRLEREAELDGATTHKHAQAMVEFERAMVRMADLTVAITDDEAEMIRQLEPAADVLVVPNIHDSPRSSSSFYERSGLVFVGSYRHTPNRDAIRWMTSEIMPLIWEQDPNIVLHLVGSDMPSDVVTAPGSNIIIEGWIEDLGPIFDSIRVSLAPLRFGAGMKGKVGDSLIRGVPVVSTSIGAEGFGPVAAGLTIADSAQEFAKRVLELYSDRLLWEEMSDRGHALADEYLGLRAAIAAVERLVEHRTADEATG